MELEENVVKATGITRRIDELGRIVIPKEIRRTLRIREGDPLEIFTDKEGGVILRKYSPIGELGEIAKEYAEAVAGVAKCTVCITDRDTIIAAAGPDKKDFMGKDIHGNLMDCIEGRKTVSANAMDAKYCRIIDEDDSDAFFEAISTIVAEGDAIGAVVLLSKDKDDIFGDFEEKTAICGANFLGRQMEN
ncbi:MAG: stage V sporulation protein T [Lachnospiraceae bacterium]|nr:stage V sporulation protein T [Lachnospiraceae bacterium]